MTDLKQFASAVSQLSEEKGIPKDKIIETIEMAIAAAYKKDHGMKRELVKAEFNQETGEAKLYRVKRVIADEEKKEKEEEGKYNEEVEISLAEAKKEKKSVKEGDELKYPLPATDSYGRIASQTAKQIIIQKIREAEREVVLSQYQDKIGQIVTGTVQRLERGIVFFDIGNATGVLLPHEQVASERYKIGERFRLYILKVEDTSRGAQVLVSRSSEELVRAMFEEEVPEIRDGIVEIKDISREAGSRSKMSVVTNDEDIDPIGACIGQRGGRVQVIIDELGGEKIDVIEWREDQEKYIAASLSPATVEDVIILDKENKQAKAVVNEDQLSLAIGKKGQNVRLAVKLTGWKIDVVKKGEEDKEVPPTKGTKEDGTKGESEIVTLEGTADEIES